MNVNSSDQLFMLDFTNPQKRKEFDKMRLYQQQKELQKWFGVRWAHGYASKGQGLRNQRQELCHCFSVLPDSNQSLQRHNYEDNLQQRFILLVILANCCFLAIDDPNLEELPFQVYADYIFLCIFTAEMIFKVIAMGFALRPYSYLRDGWNILDFIVVVMGWFSKVVSANNVSAIRVIRILRPLRTINSIPTMRKLVQSLLNSLPTLFDIFVLFIFFHIMFGTVGTQLFGGLNDYRCFISDGTYLNDSDGNDIFCIINPDNTDNCPTGRCGYLGAPEFNAVSFDNVLKAILNVFIIITLEGWTDRMYYIRRATGVYYYDIYFILVVLIGVFFILNLMVAVQFSYFNASFIEAQKQIPKSKPSVKAEEETPKDENEEDQPNIGQQDFSQAISLITENKDQHKSQQEVAKDGQLVRKTTQQQRELKKKRCQYPLLIKFRAKVLFLVESRPFNIFIIFLIILNTTFMAMEHYDMDQTWSKIIDTANSTLTCLFAAEMVLKLVGMGFRNYVRDSFNDFDAIIVIVGLLEFLNAGSKVLTVLRSFRLLRIFKIVKSWKALKKILQTVLKAFSSITNLGLLIFLLSFIYALIGMQFLSGPLPPDQINNFRQTFNSFGESILCIFILLTNENWNGTMTQYIDLKGYGSVVFFISNIVFANIMLLNMFLAILISYISDNMEEGDQETEEKTSVAQISAGQNQPDDKVQGSNDHANDQKNEVVEETFDFIQERMRIKAGLQQQHLKRLANGESSLALNGGNQKEGVSAFNVEEISNERNNVAEINIKDIAVNIEDRSQDNQNKISEKSQEVSQKLTVQQNPDSNLPNEFSDQNEQGVLQLQKDQLGKEGEHPNEFQKSLKTKKKQTQIVIEGRSLFCLAKNSKIRLYLKAFIEHSYFENFIYHMIGLNTFILAINEPTNTDPYQNSIIDLIVNIISGVFVAEATIKIIVMGFVFGQGSYLRDTWNVLDFIIVSFSVLTWILDQVSSISVSFLRGFRALRALRPLRMVSKNEGMKVLVDSLLISIPQLFNVFLISLLFFVVFGILGIQLFKGSMSHCNDINIGYKSDCVGQYFDSDHNVMTDRQWITPFINFDNIFSSTNTFFEVCNLENWPTVLYATVDSVGYDQGPQQNSRQWASLIFVVFIFITTFFVMNLFTSVIVDKFNEEMKKKEGSHSFSEEQKEWVKMQRIMMHVKLKILPVMPKNPFRKLFFNIVTSTKFEYFIMMAIAINTVFICLDYYDSPTTYSLVIDYANYVFVSIFGCEALFKIIAHGKFYFLDSWNIFDFVIVVLSFITIDQSLFSFKVTALRIIRVARLLRMIKVSKGLRHLLKTLWLAVGNVINVALLLCLVFTTYAIAGMELFGNAYFTDLIEHDANFSTFYLSFSLLFRCQTGENWNGLMHDYYDQYGAISYVYFVTFQFISHYILTNVLVAVVYDSFNDVQASEDDNEVLSLKRKDIKAFVKTWAIFCPNGEHYMKTSQLSAFLMKLPPPLGYEGHRIEQSKLNKIIFCLNIKNHIKDNEGKVYFPEVMWAIFHSIIGNNDEQVHKCEQVVNIMSLLKRKYKGLGKNVTPDSLCGNKYYRTEMSVSKYLCAMQIYKNWIKYKGQREKVKAERLLLNEQQKDAINKAIEQEAKPVTGLSLRESDNSISAKGSRSYKDGLEDVQSDSNNGRPNIAHDKSKFTFNGQPEEVKEADRAKDGSQGVQNSEGRGLKSLKSKDQKSVSLSSSSVKSEVSVEVPPEDYRQDCCSHGEECNTPNCKHVCNQMSFPSERISNRSRSHGRLGNQEERRVNGSVEANNFNFTIMKGKAKENLNEEMESSQPLGAPQGFFKEKTNQKVQMEKSSVSLEIEKNSV